MSEGERLGSNSATRSASDSADGSPRATEPNNESLSIPAAFDSSSGSRSSAQVKFTPEQKFDLLGFSMGGLVSRYYLRRLNGIARVRRFISISCPHNGTLIAFLRSNAGARLMRPGSPFLSDLNSDTSVLDRIRVTSIWTPFDLMTFPASSSLVAFGRSVRVGVLAHPLMIRSRRVLRSVLRALTLELP
jgi:triacylglycerol lipase